MCFCYFYVYVISLGGSFGGKQKYLVALGSSLEHTFIVLALALANYSVSLADTSGVELGSNLGLKIEKTGEDEFSYTYVSVDDKNRNFLEKMYRFPIPSSELTSNSLVNQFPEWN